MEILVGRLALRILGAAILAAPLFILFSMLPGGIVNLAEGNSSFEFDDILKFLLVGTFMSFFGVFVALPACLFGGFVMAALGLQYSWARARLAWMAIGGVLGIPVGLIFGGDSETPADATALAAGIAAAATCALICRGGRVWTEKVEWEIAEGESR